ncbi:hypothetical protein IGI04_005425 [Brassica rapa subsp. trilocularis]|uniref:Uncharacterized protein n=1 Tax=Brassica rapa subsp. trilocularis TaxID=1813537 RepID=A0ABQ7NFM4_BRACM|nr:hypothetical protein IGI04_005425 [Brassica rapa subsp. trilocularis]
MVRIKKVRKTSVLLDIITSRRAVDTASRQSIVALVIVTYLRLYLESSKVLGDIIVYLYRFVGATVAWRDCLAELQQKPCQGGAVIVNTCDLQDHTTTLYLNELIYHRR